jgi:ABC-2 type transport system ATP-binding protein
MNNIALDVRDVTIRYGTPAAGTARALDSASLTVRAGDCVGIAGTPGAGLTSLLLCGAGLVGPDAGCVRWFGSHRWHAARAAYAPARADVHAYLSVRAWLEFAAAQRVDDAIGVEPDVGTVLALASLTEFASIRVGHLTPGVSARVAIAGALLGAPRLLLLDRPFDGLTGPEGARLAQVLQYFRRNGFTLVVGTRDAAQIAVLQPDRMHYMVAGRIADASVGDATLELDVPLPIEARSRLALRVPSVYRRGRALRVPLSRVTAEQVLSECRALGIPVRASRVVGRDLPSRRRVAESPAA